MITRRFFVGATLTAPAIIKVEGLMKVSTRLVEPMFVLVRNDLRHGFKLGVERHGRVNEWHELLYGPEENHPFDRAEVSWSEWGKRGMLNFNPNFRQREYADGEYKQLVDWWRDSKPIPFNHGEVQ